MVVTLLQCCIFAHGAADVFGSTSSAARVGDAKADKEREAEIISYLLVRYSVPHSLPIHIVLIVCV